VLYSTARFIVEFFREHQQGNLLNGPFDTSQYVSVVLFAFGAWLYVRRSISSPDAGAWTTQKPQVG